MTDDSAAGPILGRMTELPSHRDLMVGALLARGRWVVANVSGSLFWPTKVQTSPYRGFDIFILPPTREGHFPALAVKLVEGQAETEARKAIMGFLSALCWINSHVGAHVESWTGGSMAYGMVGRGPVTLSAHPFELDYLPDPTDPKARLALALCREAAGLNSATYAVISYFRVFETHFQGTSRDIKAWLNAKIGSVTDGCVRDIIDRLTSMNSDVGAYLYDACRSAAAHGKIGARVIIDPDDPEDERRLARDLPLIRAMAIKLTEEILGVQTTSTVYREHLYELAGFKPRFTREALDAFVASQSCPEGQVVDLPNVNIGLLDHSAFSALCGLEPVHLEEVEGGVKAVWRRPDGLVEFHAILDFKSERLVFEIGQDLPVFDDQTAEAMEVAASVVEFQKGYFLNGRLRIDDANTGQLLSRKDAFIPLNVRVNPAGFDAQVARCLREAEGRRELAKKVWRTRATPSCVSYYYKPPNRPDDTPVPKDEEA